MKKYFNRYLIWFLIIIFSFAYSFYSLIRHRRLESLVFDLGIYDQMIWLASQGKRLYSTILDMPFFADHFTISLVLLSPLFWLWNNVKALLIFQAVFVSIGAYPIYLLAKQKTKDKMVALCLALAYLMFYGIQNAIAYDFHPIVLATALLAWLFYFYNLKKWRLFWPILILILGLQENFALLTMGLGAFLFFQYKDYRRGIIISLLGLSWFLTVIYIIVPFSGHNNFFYMPLHLANKSLWEMLKMMIYPESKIMVILASLLGFGLLPVFSPFIFIFFLEEAIQRFVGSPFATRWVTEYQYNAIFAPIMAVGFLDAYQRYFSKKKRIVIFMLLMGIILTQLVFKPGLSNYLKPGFFKQTRENVDKLLAFIPKNSSVATTNNLGAHLSHREKIILLTNCLEDKTLWGKETKRCFSVEPDYLIVDLSFGDNNVAYYPDYSKQAIINYLNYLETHAKYRLIKEQDMIYLWQKI